MAMDSTPPHSPCILHREIPTDYLLDLQRDRVNHSNKTKYESWEKDQKDTMDVINDLLKESFITASQEIKFTFTRHGKQVICTTTREINKEWKNNPDHEEDYAYICRGHFEKSGSYRWRRLL